MRTTKDKIMIVLGALFGLYVCYVLVMMNDDRSPVWYAVYAFLSGVIVMCARGIFLGRREAYFLSLVLAGAGLGLGIYLAHFAWTFWIFKEPSVFDRLGAVLHPRISIFLLVPAAWLIYFTRRNVRARYGA